MMRLAKLVTVLSIAVALATGLLWCAGPCCGSARGQASSASIGMASCCGSDLPSRCQPSMRGSDEAPVPSPVTSPTLSAALGGRISVPPGERLDLSDRGFPNPARRSGAPSAPLRI